MVRENKGKETQRRGKTNGWKHKRKEKQRDCKVKRRKSNEMKIMIIRMQGKATGKKSKGTENHGREQPWYGKNNDTTRRKCNWKENK